MRNFTKLFALGAIMFGFSLSSKAQGNTATSAPTTASAVIVAPITISAGSELKFGQVVSSGAAGTVVVTAAGARSATGGSSFSPGTSGGPVASTFTVTGEIGYTYTVTLPAAPVTLTGTSGAALTGPATMTADTFTKSIVTGSLATDGTEDFTVGATLNVGISQAAGAYSGSYTVKVDYE